MRSLSSFDTVQVLTVHSPKVLSVAHVPGCGVAHNLSAIFRFFDHRVGPEIVKEFKQIHGHEELLSLFEQP